MYYTASSVINVLTNHPKLSVDNTDPLIPYTVPSCPKQNNSNADCVAKFPECEGKNIGCSQKLRLKNEKDNPVIVELFFYIDRQSRDGRIKKQNETLKLIKSRYGLDTSLLKDA